jgi:chromosome segregation protein
LNVLEQLQAEHEGFSAGSLAALKQTEAVLGSLADRIRVPDGYVAAIEAALGHHLQLVLTEHPETAQRILADLSASQTGRASIAPLALGQGRPGLYPDPEPLLEATVGEGDPALTNETQPHVASGNGHHESGHGASFPFNGDGATSPLRATSVVQTDQPVATLVNRLLGTTRIVPDLAAATEAWHATRGDFDFVTLSGDVLSRHGVYTGGSGNGSGHAPASILGRKNQIADLQATLAQLQGRSAEASRRKGALQSGQAELQAGLQQAQSELRAQEVAIATREGEFNILQNSQRVLHQKIDTVVYEIQSLAAQEQEGQQKRAALATQLSELEARERAHQEDVTGFTAALENLRQQRDTATAALSETKVALATQEQLCASFRQQQSPLQQRIQELTHLAEQRRQEIGAFANRKVQCEAEIADSRRQIVSLQGEREQVNSHTAVLCGEKEALESDLAGREDALREQRRRLAQSQEQRGAIEVELAQKEMATQNLRERIQQKYQVKLEDVRSECITITFADEGPPKVHTLTPEEMAASGAATDWNVVAEQVAALQKRIEEMGPVNLVAIEEYEETEQRYQFLTKQYDDLVKAKEQLLQVINRINTQTKEMFTETFHKIRENFRAMFTEIFGGGKADLMLVDEGDVLESGIEIMARPPGKQLQSISLLSGGEQTMTAVALLFSIYQVKPSPFCVLDELDAPLDESNINRFIRILQRFLAHSQFVIITHNKRTIGMADVLYGITMQEQGVSKVVSVKFHKADEVVTDHTPESLETPVASVAPIEPEEDKLQPREEMLEVVMAK